MSEVYNQYNPTTYRLLRGLRRSIPDVPEFASSPPVSKQKRRVKLVAIYGQPIIAHCISQGEFLYPKVVGHKIIQLDDDDGTMRPDTTDDDTRKPHGTYGCFTVEDYQFLKNNKAYQRIRIKLSSSALEIRPWGIGGSTSAKGLLPSPASRAWAGYIEATLSVNMPMIATYHREHDVCNTNEAQSSPDAARATMPPARMAEPAAVTDMTGLSRYKDQVCRFIRGLRLTMPEAAYRVKQVKRQKGLKTTIAIDLTAMANHVQGDQFVHWMAVGQLLAWLVGNCQHTKMAAMSSMPTRDASVTAIHGPCSNQPVDVYSKLYRKNDTNKQKREDNTCSPTAGDTGHVDTELRKDKESIGHHKKSAENQGVLEETTQAAHGGHGDTVKDAHEEYEEKAAQLDHIDDGDEERIIRLEHIWSSDGEEEQKSKSTSAFLEHGCHTDTTVERDGYSMCVQAMVEHGCHTDTMVEEDDDSWCGVLGLYACGQAGVFF